MTPHGKAIILISILLIAALLTGIANADDITIGSSQSALSAGNAVPVGELEAIGEVIGSGGCSGTLIADNLVLSAAHCFCNGNTNCVGKGQFILHDVRPVTDPSKRTNFTFSGTVRIHPEYEDRGWQREDYAVLELDTPVSTKALVTPIPVEDPWNIPFAGETLTLVGFGKTGDQCKSQPQGKMKMDVPVKESGWGGISFKDDRLYVCPGDSGGPILNKAGHVVGVASWGDNSVSVYRPTSYAYNWIQGIGTPLWKSCTWVPIETVGINSHSPIELCPDGSYLTALDLDGDRTISDHDAPVIGQARCCKIEGAEQEKWESSQWVPIEKQGLSSHSMGGSWCPQGSFITGIDLDSCSACDGMDSPVIGQVQCSKPPGNEKWGSTYWMDVGAEKSHQQQDWCLDGAFITQLDLDRAGNADPHDSPVVGKAKCSVTRAKITPLMIQMFATPQIAVIPVTKVPGLLTGDIAPQIPEDVQTVKPQSEEELDTNRPGSDYTSFEIDTPDPSRCADACREDKNCMAYTYVKPGVQGENAVCWLKSGVPDALPDACCVSGVIRKQ